jgi:hypothetical protein
MTTHRHADALLSAAMAGGAWPPRVPTGLGEASSGHNLFAKAIGFPCEPDAGDRGHRYPCPVLHSTILSTDASRTDTSGGQVVTGASHSVPRVRARGRGASGSLGESNSRSAMDATDRIFPPKKQIKRH